MFLPFLYYLLFQQITEKGKPVSSNISSSSSWSLWAFLLLVLGSVVKSPFFGCLHWWLPFQWIMDGRWGVEPWKKVQSEKEKGSSSLLERRLSCSDFQVRQIPFFRRVLSEDVKDLEFKKERWCLVVSSCVFVVESCRSCCGGVICDWGW